MSVVRRTVAALVVFGAAAALPPPASAVDQNKVNEAIVKGGNYLKNLYSRGIGGNGSHGLGQVALSGMAMLEAGIKPDDPAMLTVIQAVRSGAIGQNGTYHLSLAILFLDRLGDPRDVPTIQFLGARLYSGLMNSGWTYSCSGQLNAAEVAQWSAVLQQPFRAGTPKEKAGQKKSDSGFPTTSDGPKTPVGTKGLHPAVKQYLSTVRAGGRGVFAPGGGGDNSNTQFGLIGLWVAAQHGLPMEEAFATIEAHFLTTQNRNDGGWGYSGGESGSTGAMTCAGLLGLAVGAARKAKPDLPEDPKKPRSNNPFDNPTKPAGGSDPIGPKPAVPGATAEHRKDAIDKALTAIGLVVQKTPPQGGAGEGALGSYVGHGDMFYLCWSIERVAVAFGLETIGDQDWYSWGCGYLLPSQGQDGSFANGRFGSEVSTAFAVLFLCKSNFVKSLTSKLGGAIRDPKERTLRGNQGATPLLAPKRNIDDLGPDGSSIPGGTGPNPETVKPIAGLTGEPIADGLIAANAQQWTDRLKLVKDTKGPEYTAALVRAIPRLDIDRRQQAREALAERLSRMSAATLRTMLKQQDPEYRRAACLACAMRDDKSHIPDLIDRIVDESDLVVRGARAGLRTLTGRDFGPPGGADMAGRRKAQSDWNRWYLTSGK